MAPTIIDTQIVGQLSVVNYITSYGSIGRKVSTVVSTSNDTTVINARETQLITFPTALFLVVASLGLACVCLVIAMVYCKRRRSHKLNRSELGTDELKNNGGTATLVLESTTTAYDTSHSTSMQGNTTLAGGSELALPAYMEAVDAIDFKIDPTRSPIAEGGGGIIYYAKF